MPTTFNLSKLLNRTGSGILHFSHPQLRFLSVASVLLPSHNQIADLILEQKSADEALQTFEWASRIPKFTHSPSTYRALIHKLCTFRQFRIVQQLLAEMPEAIDSPPDDDIFITVARGYGRAKMTREVVRVLDLVPKLGKGCTPSLKLMNTILDILVKEDIDIAREFYRKKMMGSGMKGDHYTYGILMKGFCRTNRIGDGFKLLQIMKNHNVDVNAVVYNTLIYALCKNGKVGRARSLMNKMEEFSDVTFNILISAYSDDNNLVQALVMLEKCFMHSLVPDVVTLTKVVRMLCSARRLDQAVETLDRVEEKGGTVDVVAYNTLLKGFVKAGKVKLALGFLKQMEMKGCLPNTETYNTVIAGYCEGGMLDSACDMFHEMKRLGVRWNSITFETLIRGLCSSGRTKDGITIFELMVEGEGRQNTSIHPYNSILYGLYHENRLNQAYEFLNYMRKPFPSAVKQTSRILQLCEKESIEEAKHVLHEIKERGGFPSAIVYANLIQGLCRKRCTKEAVEVMSEMTELGFFPVASTLNGVVDGLCREGKVGAAMRLVKDLKARDCLVNGESYRILIDALLCSRGESGEALELLMEMLEGGIVPDFCTWNTVVLDALKGDKNLLGGWCELFRLLKLMDT